MKNVSVHEHILRDLGPELLDLIVTMQEQQNEDKDPKSLFYIGAFFAYRRVLEIILDQARLFGVANATFGLSDTIDLEALVPRVETDKGSIRPGDIPQ